MRQAVVGAAGDAEGDGVGADMTATRAHLFIPPPVFVPRVPYIGRERPERLESSERLARAGRRPTEEAPLGATRAHRDQKLVNEDMTSDPVFVLYVLYWAPSVRGCRND